MIALTVAVAVPATAGAAQIAPPGKAGATQYFETIPTSKGNVAPPSGGSSSSDSGGPTLATAGAGATGTSRLARHGEVGKAAAGFVRATAPAVPSGAATGAAGTRYPQEPTGGSAVGGLASLLTGSDAGGIGLFLPVLLGLTLLGAVFVGARRTARR